MVEPTRRGNERRALRLSLPDPPIGWAPIAMVLLLLVSAPIVLSVPIKSSETVLGTINVGSRPSARPFDKEDMAYLSGLAGQAAVLRGGLDAQPGYVVSRFKTPACLAQVEQPPAVIGRRAFDDHRLDAQMDQFEPGGAAGVGFFDPAGQWTFGSNGYPVAA